MNFVGATSSHFPQQHSRVLPPVHQGIYADALCYVQERETPYVGGDAGEEAVVDGHEQGVEQEDCQGGFAEISHGSADVLHLVDAARQAYHSLETDGGEDDVETDGPLVRLEVVAVVDDAEMVKGDKDG